MAFWYSLLSFGILFPFWYAWSKKNLATLTQRLRLQMKPSRETLFYWPGNFAAVNIFANVLDFSHTQFFLYREMGQIDREEERSSPSSCRPFALGKVQSDRY
jgi:hypothetical protein